MKNGHGRPRALEYGSGGRAHDMDATRILASLAIALALVAPPALAAGDEAQAPARIYYIPQPLLTDGFRAAHPDMDYRMRGIALDKRKDPASAAKEYRRAAYYGDKTRPEEPV